MNWWALPFSPWWTEANRFCIFLLGPGPFHKIARTERIIIIMEWNSLTKKGNAILLPLFYAKMCLYIMPSKVTHCTEKLRLPSHTKSKTFLPAISLHAESHLCYIKSHLARPTNHLWHKHTQTPTALRSEYIFVAYYFYLSPPKKKNKRKKK